MAKQILESFVGESRCAAACALLLTLVLASCAPKPEPGAPAAQEKPTAAAEQAPVQPAGQPAEAPEVQAAQAVEPQPAPAPAETPALPLPTLEVKPIEGEAPAIDGRLTDAAWLTAAQVSEYALPMGEKPTGQTRFLVTYNADLVYLAVEAFDDPKALENPATSATEHDQNDIWDGDCVELFIDPTGKREKYYQFIISPKGVTWDAFHHDPGLPDTSWNPDYPIAVNIGPSSWVIEMALPLTAFSMTKEHSATWAFNVSRTRKAADELTYWSPPMDSTSHRPDRFGTLQNMPVPPAGASAPGAAPAPEAAPATAPDVP